MGIGAMEINEHLFHKLIEEAVSYERAEKWLHAAQIYERMLAEMPDAHYLRYNLANVYARLGNINAAENAIITAIKEGADEIHAYEELCKILLQYDEYTRIIELLSKLAIRLHSSPGVHFLLALAYSAQ
ncbi:MAG: tetratricopeptide repeat protein, partial [Chlorobi bacterium]|nr:tetratricopeptide repeat protein [Chlorobiota bacterium]